MHHCPPENKPLTDLSSVSTHDFTINNYTGGNTTQERPGKLKAETSGHPISSKTWTAKSMCSHLHAEWILHKQTLLSDNSEKDIRKYHATLGKVFDALSDAE